MIEVEVKYSLTPEQEEHLLRNATFISQEKQANIYYDKPKYELSLKDMWLRSRNGSFTLKIPIPTQAHHNIVSRHEITDEQLIKKYLNLSMDIGLELALTHAEIKPLYTLIKERKKYSNDNFIIDVDTITFPTFILRRCEIELLVETEQEIPGAQQRIYKFALQQGISSATPQEYSLDKDTMAGFIKYINPEHYALLKAAWEKKYRS